MNSIGQFDASAAKFSAEATNALVNVNLEFSLFTKQNRIQEAEGGVRHGVARKLGVLFKDKDILPSTPELIRAYGLRASEIAQKAAAFNHGGAGSSGVFEDMIGTDATTLWAAATSGRAAIHCHLLACMLARIWDPPEATSIWVEIITRRKITLRQRLEEEGELEYELVQALAEEIRRADIFDWDASARAWLRVADKAMGRQQTQAKLIIDNLDLPVNSKPDTYDSCLLGMQQEIKQNDSLFTGRGVLTVGLEPSPRVANDRNSVYWSLPLAHLRYYGRLPVTRLRSIRSTDRDRLTVDELLWAMLAAYIQTWDDGSIPTTSVLQYVNTVAIELHSALPHGPRSTDGADSSWLDHLQSRRFCPGFGSPFLGAFNVETYLKAGSSIEAKIELLREIASSMSSEETSTSDRNFIITYRSPLSNGLNMYEQGQSQSFFEYATAIPEVGSYRNSKKTHRRWIVLPNDLFTAHKEDIESQENDIKTQEIQIGSLKEDIEARRKKTQTLKEELIAGEKKIEDRRKEIENLREEASQSSDPKQPTFSRRGGRREALYHGEHGGGSHAYIEKHTTTRSRPAQASRQGPFRLQVTPYSATSSDSAVDFAPVYGDPENIALLRITTPVIHSAESKPASQDTKEYQLSVGQIMRLFQRETVDFNQCARNLMVSGACFKRVLAMTFIEDMYRKMEGATIDVRAVQVDLDDALWVGSALKQGDTGSSHVDDHNRYRQGKYLSSNRVDAATCFACIAMMETGSYNLNPDELKSVFALCAADSLYVASSLLQDPASRDPGPLIQRFTGNIGKAGMSFMVPPKEPEIRRYDSIDEWYQYDHNTFTGEMEDCFQATTLHISFSDAWQAINVNFSGGRDVEAYFLETLVSVYNRGEWIAELDISGAMANKGLIREYVTMKPCLSICNPGEYAMELISIDNFAEMIIPPKRPGLVRAKGNWEARLAAASLCIAKGYQVVLKPEDTCLACFLKQSAKFTSDKMAIPQDKNVSIII
ncbi:hypothetical protein F5Y16DRAFT_413434 [Xylariaceae sp. FL0255]|nr:hypothetical protein F5Y16DRAFT_413434 [Xylariaceae sp. FL0255]